MRVDDSRPYRGFDRQAIQSLAALLNQAIPGTRLMAYSHGPATVLPQAYYDYYFLLCGDGTGVQVSNAVAVSGAEISGWPAAVKARLCLRDHASTPTRPLRRANSPPA